MQLICVNMAPKISVPTKGSRAGHNLLIAPGRRLEISVALIGILYIFKTKKQNKSGK